jgi:hypothetical protein
LAKLGQPDDRAAGRPKVCMDGMMMIDLLQHDQNEWWNMRDPAWKEE